MVCDQQLSGGSQGLNVASLNPTSAPYQCMPCRLGSAGVGVRKSRNGIFIKPTPCSCFPGGFDYQLSLGTTAVHKRGMGGWVF